jgi:hypothetical protein
MSNLTRYSFNYQFDIQECHGCGVFINPAGRWVKYDDIKDKIANSTPSANQQLKAEIFALVNKLCTYTCELDKNNYIRQLSEQLLKLSAV